MNLQVEVHFAEEFVGEHLVFLLEHENQQSVWDLLNAHEKYHKQYPLFVFNALKPLAKHMSVPSAAATVQVHDLLINANCSCFKMSWYTSCPHLVLFLLPPKLLHYFTSH